VTTAYEDLLVDVAAGVGTITINRPERRNALRPSSLAEMAAALEGLADDVDVGVVVITGSGDKAFCGGGDLNQVGGPNRDTTTQGTREVLRWVTAFRQCPKPVIAKVSGFCIGLGNELNLLCDLTIADETAKFGQAGPRVGSVPMVGGTQLLPMVCGLKRAKEILLLCRLYSGDDAVRVGLANVVVPAADLDDEVDRWATELLAMSPQSLRMSKLSLSYLFDAQWPGLQAGLELTGWMVESAEMQEGAGAFLERRPADFRGAASRRRALLDDATTVATPQAVVVRHMDAMLADDLGRVMLGFDDRSVVRAGGAEYVGRVAIEAHFAELLAKSPPGRVVAYDVVTETDGRVTLRWRLRLSADGDVVMSGADHCTVEDGIIVSQDVVHDERASL
jgi:dihydroxynaphthoic acid synthetase